MLNTQGYKIDTFNPERADSYDLSKYDYLITTDNILASSVLLQDTKNTKIKYKIDKDGNAYFEKLHPFTCIYVDHYSGDAYNPSIKGQTIVTSSCYFSKDFFKLKGFDFVQSYDFYSDIKENANFMTIYKNNSK